MLDHIRDKVLGLKEEERRKFYSACFSFPSSQALGFSELMEVIQKIPSRDEVRIFCRWKMKILHNSEKFN